MTKIVAIIPARYKSTRFPGKMLAQINGKTLIKHVYDRVMEMNLFTSVHIATDDVRIQEELQKFKVKVIMTSQEHHTGTDRIIEALDLLNLEYDYVVNVQGDEALISKLQLAPLQNTLIQEQEDIVSLMVENHNFEDYTDSNCVKVVVDQQSRALYFSRSPIPFVRSQVNIYFYQHLGVYAFSKNTIHQIKNLAPTRNEKLEKLEQLRWLDHGMKIRMVKVKGRLIGIDTEEDMNLIQGLL